MVNHPYNELFYKGSTDKQWKIKYGNGVIGNDDELFSESIQIDESLCSDSDLVFGRCEASIFKFKVANIFASLKGEWLDVSVIIDDDEDNQLNVGRYKVLSDNVTADRQWRDVIAYDAMYDIINSDATDWYNSILPNKDSKVNMRQFRKSFIEYFGLKESETQLANDDMIIEKTISIQSEDNKNDDVILEEIGLSGKDVITAICEINGCFGHIGRDGNFCYIYLPQNVQGLYPAGFLHPGKVPTEYDYLFQSESGNLYPQDAKGFEIGISNYVTCEYEDYHTKSINKLQIRQEENDIGVIWQDEKATSDNCYTIQGNFLVYGKSSKELSTIAKNIYEKIKNVIYRPFSADCVGNLCLEVGDPVRISTTYSPVESYILKRTLKGIQALRDSYSSSGNERRAEQTNSVHASIIQLKGKSNVLSRSIEETQSTIANVEENLQTQITQNANFISLESTKRENEDKELSGKIDVAAGQIVLKAGEDGKIVAVELTVNPEDGTEFKVEADNISLSAQEAINFLAGGTLNLTGENIKIESDNFSVDENGNATVSSIDIIGGSINIGDKFIVDENGICSQLEGEFAIDAKNLNLTAEEVISLMSGGTLNLSGKNISIESDNFNVSPEGLVDARSLNITGGSINIETCADGENIIFLKNASYEGAYDGPIRFFVPGTPKSPSELGAKKGDFYYDTTNKKLYKCTEIAVLEISFWIDIFSDDVEIPDKISEIIRFYGSGEPKNTPLEMDARIFDLYIDIETADVYEIYTATGKLENARWRINPIIKRKKEDISWKELSIGTDNSIKIKEYKWDYFDGLGYYKTSNEISIRSDGIELRRSGYTVKMGSVRPFESSGNIKLEEEIDESNNVYPSIVFDVPVKAPNII